jgi:hypothetical protein
MAATAVTWNSGIVDAKIAAACTRAVVGAVEGILGEGNRLIASPPKTGRIYRRRGVEHQASAPGESPASDTGALIATSQPSYPDQGSLFDIVGYANWSTGYAAFLERGTAKMEPRPYARPALDLIAPTLADGIRAQLLAAGVRAT